MYTVWPDQSKEQETQFYPWFPIFCYPKKYQVQISSGIIVYKILKIRFLDALIETSVRKYLTRKLIFSYGIFSIACHCKYNITYGFELMLHKESAHNLFR